MLEIHGLKIDIEHIATGLLGIMPENYRNALRFGLLPGPMIDKAVEVLKSRFQEHRKAYWDSTLTPTRPEEERIYAMLNIKGEYDSATQEQEREVVSKFNRELALELYRIGDLVV